MLLPGMVITMPEDPEDEQVQEAAAAAAAGTAEDPIPVAAPKSGRGRPAGRWPEELTPRLVHWLQSHPSVHSLDKAVQVCSLHLAGTIISRQLMLLS